MNTVLDTDEGLISAALFRYAEDLIRNERPHYLSDRAITMSAELRQIAEPKVLELNRVNRFIHYRPYQTNAEPLKQGLNRYHPANADEGFFLRIHNFVWHVRRRKKTKKWHSNFIKIDPHAMEKMKAWYDSFNTK